MLRTALLLLALVLAAHAQAGEKKKPKPKPVNVPYCIENICLNDPISKFNSAQPDVGQTLVLGKSKTLLDSLSEGYPACSYQAYAVTMYGPLGQPLRVTFYPYAAAKGAHYRVGGVSEAIADNVSLEQARRIFDSKRVGKFEEVSPAPFTFSAKFRESRKDEADVGYYLNLLWQQGGVHVLYSSEQLRNQIALTQQPGCEPQDSYTSQKANAD